MKRLKTVLLVFILGLSGFVQTSPAQQTKFTRPTFKAKRCAETPFWHVKVFEDDDYTFVYRHYGSENYVPGFFVYGKKQDKWVEIKKLSTENAKLGHSPSMDEVKISVSWEYKDMKKFDYVNTDLKTSGSINFPDKIEYDSSNQAYCLKYNSSLNREESLTTFWVLKKEIERSLAR